MAAWRGLQPESAPRPSSAPAPDDAARLVVDAVGALHVNGAESDRTEYRAAELGAALGRPARVDLGWSTSDVEVAGAAGTTIHRVRRTPDGLGLNRVTAIDAVADGLARHELTEAQARQRLDAALALPPAGTALFAAACAVGACCLAVIFGVRHPGTLLLIAVAAVIGALVRRLLGRLGVNSLWQVAVAGLLAGLSGAASQALGIGSPLGLAAICPSMILVPGPHLLKGAIDVATLRIPLGVGRLVFASVTLAAITAGLLSGLAVGGASLAPAPAGREVPIWIDVPAAGVVAVCYGVFYSAPLRVLVWPLVLGMAAHALRWTALEVLHLESWLAAGLACVLVAAVLVPVSRARSIPFSAIGFASVVSLMPGVLVFRALGALAQLQTASPGAGQRLLVQGIGDANVAGLTVAAMAAGLLVPTLVWDRVLARRATP